jgi:hypothetical protein
MGPYFPRESSKSGQGTRIAVLSHGSGIAPGGERKQQRDRPKACPFWIELVTVLLYLSRIIFFASIPKSVVRR